MAYANDIKQEGARLSDAPARLARTIAQRWRAHRAYRTTLNELRSLSDRELNDLGLNQSMLRSIAREASRDA
ncbi:MAG: DUF1127 domain-containing protein [Pseudomonadota bacterium]